MLSYATLVFFMACVLRVTAHCCDTHTEDLCALVSLAAKYCTCEGESPSTDTGNEECPTGWESFGTSCYWLSEEGKTWDEAKTSCEELGATLAEIENSSENDFLKGLGRNRPIWLGGTDRVVEGQWMWAGSNTPFSFTDWNPGEPNNARSEQCLNLWRWQGVYGWNDFKCAFSIIFLCEKK